MGPALIPIVALITSMVADQGSERTKYGRTIGNGNGNGNKDELHNLADKLEELSRAADEPTMKAVGLVDREVERNIRSIVRTAPKTIARRVAEVVRSSAKAHGVERPDEDPLLRPLLEDLDEANGPLEAAEVMEKTSKALERAPYVRDATDQVLEFLDEQGLIGTGALSVAVSILLAAGATGISLQAFRSGETITLKMPGLSISADRIGNYAVDLRIPPEEDPVFENAVRVGLSLAVKGTPKYPVQAAKVEIPITRRKVTIAPYVEASEQEKKVGVTVKGKF